MESREIKPCHDDVDVFFFFFCSEPDGNGKKVDSHVET